MRSACQLWVPMLPGHVYRLFQLNSLTFVYAVGLEVWPGQTHESSRRYGGHIPRQDSSQFMA